jgi:hypothetical protein
MQRCLVPLIVCFVCSGCFAKRLEELGTFVDFVPENHANDSSYRQAGFVAVRVRDAVDEHVQPAFVAHSADEFIRLYRQLSVDVQQKAIWLTVYDMSEYSAQEKVILAQFKERCKKEGLILCIHKDR